MFSNYPIFLNNFYVLERLGGMDSYFVIKLRLKKLLSYSVIFISLLILNLLPTSDFRYKFLTLEY